tara:strand:+ start:1243 stop:1407 length:165 start_codon:yes stop_codon:yes gene_type:complete
VPEASAARGDQQLSALHPTSGIILQTFTERSISTFMLEALKRLILIVPFQQQGL